MDPTYSLRQWISEAILSDGKPNLKAPTPDTFIPSYAAFDGPGLQSLIRLEERTNL